MHRELDVGTEIGWARPVKQIECAELLVCYFVSKKQQPEKPLFHSRKQANMGVKVALVVAAASAAALAYGPALLGFTSAGIADSSAAASMMSASAVASRGGVAAGGVVATLQSIGAREARLGATGYAVSGVIGAICGYYWG